MGAPGTTPGPWRDGDEAILVNLDRANPWAGTVLRVSEMSDERALVAMTFGPTPEECAATARAIAANPGFYDLLEWIAAFADVRSNDESKVFARVNRGALRTIRDKANAALALARGEPSNV